MDIYEDIEFIIEDNELLLEDMSKETDTKPSS